MEKKLKQNDRVFRIDHADYFSDFFIRFTAAQEVIQVHLDPPEGADPVVPFLRSLRERNGPDPVEKIGRFPAFDQQARGNLDIDRILSGAKTHVNGANSGSYRRAQ